MFKAFLKKVEETTNNIETSIIQSLKSKDTAAKSIDNIIKEIPPIPESIKNIDLSLKPAGPPANYYKENIDLHPGSIFLKKYQEKLGELHSNNVILSKKAEAVDRKLPTLLRQATSHHDLWKKMQGELARLPELSANVSNIRNQIDFVLVRFDELEVLLTQQVEQYHATELAKYKEKLVSDGLKYQAQKQKELSSLEEELATAKARYERDKANKEKEQARLLRLEQEQQRRKKEEEEARERKKKQEQELQEKKQREEEEKRERKQREEEEKREKKQKEEEERKRQEKLHDTFKRQVEQFKETGNVGPVTKNEEPVAPLETIVPEENPQALEEFFQDLVNSSDKLKKEAEGGEEERNPLVKPDETVEEKQDKRGEEIEDKEKGEEKEEKEKGEEKEEEKGEEKEKETEKTEEKNAEPTAIQPNSEEKTTE